MSWQSYIDDNLMIQLPSGGTLTSAAILGHDGGAWAKSATFPDLPQSEIDSLNAGIQNVDALAATGFLFGGVKYMIIKSENNVVIRGMKGKSGIVVKKTNAAYVIGIFDEPTQSNECSVLVENLGDYLASTGY